MIISKTSEKLLDKIKSKNNKALGFLGIEEIFLNSISNMSESSQLKIS